MATEKDIFLHVGLPKTGTKALQSTLSERIPGAAVTPHMDNFLQNYCFASTARSTVEEYADALLAEVTSPPDHPRIISCEALLGAAFANGSLFPRAFRLSQVVEHYVAGGYQVHLLLVVRNPVQFIQSWYLQTISTGQYSAPLSTYVDTVVRKPFSWLSLSNFLSKQATSLTVLPYEMCLENRAAFADALNFFFQRPGLFEAVDFEHRIHASMGEDLYKIMRAVSTLGDPNLGIQVYETLVSAANKNQQLFPQRKRPTLMSPLMRQGLSAALYALDHVFADQVLSLEVRPYYLAAWDDNSFDTIAS